MLGAKSVYAEECRSSSFIGADFGISEDLTKSLHENWKDFNRQFIPIWMKEHPGKGKISAGLSCGALWTIVKGISKGDMVLCPNGEGSYMVGEVTSNYFFTPAGVLPHRRTVNWYQNTISRSDMSDALRNSSGSIGTVSDISKYAVEIERLIGNIQMPSIICSDDTVEDLATFALEKHLEDFLVKNWKQTLLGKEYDIFEEDGELVGQQYPSDTGNMDILAVSKDKSTLLVVELKKGRASDNVVGQIQRYMGYVKEELAEPSQQVKGVIIALEDDQRIKRALSVANNIEFYRYEINFKLHKN